MRRSIDAGIQTPFLYIPFLVAGMNTHMMTSWHGTASRTEWLHIQIAPLMWLLTHWSRVTHICVSRLTITGSDNGFSPGRRQAIIWTNARILLIGPLGTNFSEKLIEILAFSFTKIRLKMSSAKWRPFCLDLNGLIDSLTICEVIINLSPPGQNDRQV